MSKSQPGTAVLLAGATGLVGRQCLELLLADLSLERVTAIVRRPIAPRTRSEKLNVETVDFEHLDERPSIFAVNQIYCALGTTMRQARSQTAFRLVDYEYPLRVAKLGLDGGATHFLLVSSLGADPRSRVFYNRVKGELEEAIGGLGYRALTIVRPSVLVGDREEWRPVEKLAQSLAFLTPSRLRPVHATQVAAALVNAAREDIPGRRVIENRELHKLTQ